MVSISAERINKTSPYKVSDCAHACYVDFTTDHGVRYSVGYEATDLLASTEAYEFVIINVNRKHSPRDPKLRDTIMAIVYDFFLSSNTAMLYFCETGDDKQSMRERLFRYWAMQSQRHDDFAIVLDSITDEYGVRNYATLIIRNDHPRKREALNEFFETTDLLRNKPTH